MKFSKSLAWIVFLGILLYGPVDHPYLIFRIASLVAVPLLVWFVIKQVWVQFNVSDNVDIICCKGITLLVCAVLFYWAFHEATSLTHWGNTEWVRTWDGYEAVGEDIQLKGANWGAVITCCIIAFTIIWAVFFKRILDEENKS